MREGVMVQVNNATLAQQHRLADSMKKMRVNAAHIALV